MLSLWMACSYVTAHIYIYIYSFDLVTEHMKYINVIFASQKNNSNIVNYFWSKISIVNLIDKKNVYMNLSNWWKIAQISSSNWKRWNAKLFSSHTCNSIMVFFCGLDQKNISFSSYWRLWTSTYSLSLLLTLTNHNWVIFLLWYQRHVSDSFGKELAESTMNVEKNKIEQKNGDKKMWHGVCKVGVRCGRNDINRVYIIWNWS